MIQFKAHLGALKFNVQQFIFFGMIFCPFNRKPSNPTQPTVQRGLKGKTFSTNGLFHPHLVFSLPQSFSPSLSLIHSKCEQRINAFFVLMSRLLFIQLFPSFDNTLLEFSFYFLFSVFIKHRKRIFGKKNISSSCKLLRVFSVTFSSSSSSTKAKTELY